MSKEGNGIVLLLNSNLCHDTFIYSPKWQFTIRDTWTTKSLAHLLSHFASHITSNDTVLYTAIMLLLSFRSLLISCLLTIGAVAQTTELQEDLLPNTLIGNWFGEEKFPYMMDDVNGRRMEMGRFCSRVSIASDRLRTYFAAEEICEVRLRPFCDELT